MLDYSSTSDFPSYFLLIDSILPLYFSVYPNLHDVQQKNRSISANFRILITVYGRLAKITNNVYY